MTCRCIVANKEIKAAEHRLYGAKENRSP